MIPTAFEKTDIATEFEELLRNAEKEYPTLVEHLESYSANSVELETYQAYLRLLSETPTVVTANTAT